MKLSEWVMPALDGICLPVTWVLPGLYLQWPLENGNNDHVAVLSLYMKRVSKYPVLYWAILALRRLKAEDSESEVSMECLERLHLTKREGDGIKATICLFHFILNLYIETGNSIFLFENKDQRPTPEWVSVWILFFMRIRDIERKLLMWADITWYSSFISGIEWQVFTCVRLQSTLLT